MGKQFEIYKPVNSKTYGALFQNFFMQNLNIIPFHNSL